MVACICVLFCFSFLSFVSGRKAKIKWSSLGSGGRSWFWPFLHSFSSSFRSQIYITTLLFSIHAPLSRIPRRRPLLPPEARFTPIIRVRRVVCTRRQRALCSLAGVMATLRLFLAVRDGAVVYGGWSTAAWHWWRRVPPRAAVSGNVHPCLLCRLPGFCVFCLFVLCILLFLLYSLLVYCPDFIEIFVGLMLDRPFFFFFFF